MWGILVFIIIIALIMNSKKKTQYKADGKNIRTISRVRFAVEIEYDDFVKNNTFKLVHQVDATELEYNKRYRFFVDSSFIAEYSIKKITLLDENKKAIPMQRNYDMVCEAYSDCGNILLTIK